MRTAYHGTPEAGGEDSGSALVAPERDDLRFRTAVARFPGFLAAALASASLFACASPPPKATSVLAGGAAQNLLILPLNVTAVMSPELENLSALVWSELETYLRAEGRRLRTVSFRDARRLWLGSIQQARAGEKGARAGFDDAVRVLVLELAKHADFDTVIIPSLFVREAPISGAAATWDGVERSLEFEQTGPVLRGLSADSSFFGVAPAASLHAVVLDAEGNELQEAVGGLELLVRVRVKDTLGSAAQAPDLKLVPRTGLYADPENVREGIAEALAPFFLPPLPSE
jgi:hypothetical protein